MTYIDENRMLKIIQIQSFEKTFHKSPEVIGNIQDAAVWKNTVLMQALMNNLYLNIPGWNLSLASHTDESQNGSPVNIDFILEFRHQ